MKAKVLRESKQSRGAEPRLLTFPSLKEYEWSSAVFCVMTNLYFTIRTRAEVEGPASLSCASWFFVEITAYYLFKAVWLFLGALKKVDSHLECWYVEIFDASYSIRVPRCSPLDALIILSLKRTREKNG